MRANLDQRSLRGSKPNLVIVLNLLQIGINLDSKSQFYIIDYSLVIVPPRLFTLKRVVSLVFLSRHIIVLFTFFVVYDMCNGCLI